jgi:hypothetical protein
MSEHPTGQSLVNAMSNLAQGQNLKDGGIRVYSDGGPDRTTSMQANSHSAIPTGVAYDPQTKSALAPHEVTGESLIRLPSGAELTINQARQAGLIREGASRTNPFDNTQAQQVHHHQQQTTQQEPQAPSAVNSHSIGKAGEDTLSFLYTHTSATDHHKAIDQLVEHGEISEQTMGQLASQLGGHPSQVAAMIDQVRPAFEAQANRAVESVAGVDPQDVWAWAWEKNPKQIQAAMASHVNDRTTEAYKQLTRDYVSQLDTIAPEAILDAEVVGGSAARDEQGRIYFNLPNGRRVSWSEALRTGIMKLERR